MAEITNLKQNYLSPIEFRFVIKRLPYVRFFTQNVSIPGISMTPAVQQTPFKKLYHSPDTLEYDQFTVNFRVDENMQNFNEIFNWMVGLSYPSEFDQFANLDDSEDGLYSDATLLIMSNGRNPNVQFKFKNIFPIALNNIDMDTTQADIDYVSTSVTFQIESYEISVGDSG